MNAIKSFFKKIGDFFLDKNNSGDEKRLFGIAFLVGALVAFFTDVSVEKCIAMASIGGGLLGMAVVGDTMNPKLPGGQ